MREKELRVPGYPGKKQYNLVLTISLTLIFLFSGIMFFHSFEEGATGGASFDFAVAASTNISLTNYSFYGETSDSQAGADMVFADFNNDTIKDMLIGAPGFNNWVGKGYVMLGQFPAGGFNLSLANASWFGEELNSSLGWALDAGDINNDGYDDIVLGARWFDNRTGRVYLIYGHDGLNGSVNISGVSNVTFDGETNEDFAGYNLLVDDLNNDNYDDIIIGAPGFDLLFPITVNSGKISVFFGPFVNSSLSLANSNKTYFGPTNNDFFGSEMKMGDINGDGSNDLIIGSSGISKVYIVYGPIVDGLAEMINETANVTLDGTTGSLTGDHNTIDVGDSNGDGIDDVLIGSPYDTLYGGPYSGRAYLINGNSSLSGMIDLNSSLPQWYPEAPSDSAGYTVFFIDYDNDTDDDILISSPGNDEAGNLSGKVYLFYSPVNNSAINLSMADESWFGSEVGMGLNVLAIGTSFMAGKEARETVTDGRIFGFGVVPPTAFFTPSTLTGDFPLAVTFTDGSTGEITTWYWDVDGDGIYDYFTQNIVHVYGAAGIYTAKLLVVGPYGTDKYSVVITVTIPTPSGGGGYTPPKVCVDVCDIGEINYFGSGDSYQVCYENIDRCGTFWGPLEYIVVEAPPEIVEELGVLRLVDEFCINGKVYEREASMWTEKRFYPDWSGLQENLAEVDLEQLFLKGDTKIGNGIITSVDLDGNKLTFGFAVDNEKFDLNENDEINIEWEIYEKPESCYVPTNDWSFISSFSPLPLVNAISCGGDAVAADVVTLNFGNNFVTETSFNVDEQMDLTNKFMRFKLMFDGEVIGQTNHNLGETLAVSVNFDNDKFTITDVSLIEKKKNVIDENGCIIVEELDIPENKQGVFYGALYGADEELLDYVTWGNHNVMACDDGSLEIVPKKEESVFYINNDEDGVVLEVGDVLEDGRETNFYTGNIVLASGEVQLIGKFIGMTCQYVKGEEQCWSNYDIVEGAETDLPIGGVVGDVIEAGKKCYCKLDYSGSAECHVSPTMSALTEGRASYGDDKTIPINLDDYDGLAAPPSGNKCDDEQIDCIDPCEAARKEAEKSKYDLYEKIENDCKDKSGAVPFGKNAEDFSFTVSVIENFKVEIEKAECTDTSAEGTGGEGEGSGADGEGTGGAESEAEGSKIIPWWELRGTAFEGLDDFFSPFPREGAPREGEAPGGFWFFPPEPGLAIPYVITSNGQILVGDGQVRLLFSAENLKAAATFLDNGDMSGFNEITVLTGVRVTFG